MVKLLFFCFWVANSGLQKKLISLRVTNSMGKLLFFHFRVTNVKLINEKKSFNPLILHYISNVWDLWFLTTSYNSMSWGCLGMLKSRSDLGVVSNSWESIWALFRGDIPLGARDIQVQSFNHLTSSYLKWCAYSQILAFLTSLK